MQVMKANKGQSIIDLSVQLCGSAEAAMEFAVLNGISLTDEPIEIDIIPGVIDAGVVSFFSKKEIVV